MKKNKQFDIAELLLPKDYANFKPHLKKALCNKIIESLLVIIDKSVSPEYNKMEVLDEMLESSIITNQEDENYEVCQILYDVKNLININEY